MSCINCSPADGPVADYVNGLGGDSVEWPLSPSADRRHGRGRINPSLPADDPLAMVDRRAVLDLLAQFLSQAWASFDHPRPHEPHPPEDLHERLCAPLPDAPGDVLQALADAAHALDASVSPSRPLYVAYIGSTGLEAGVLGSALAATYDVNAAVSGGTIDLLENQTVQWVADFLGYPLGEGVFTSGGMISNLTAVLAAREHALPGSRSAGLGGRRAAVYCSEEAHHSVVRAVEVAGIGRDAVRRIPLDDRRRMQPEALERAILADRADGVVPVAVVATSGTTLTGAVDPLEAVADVCARREVWMHVDGAYGAPAAAAASTASLFAGLDRADSLTVDAHKWLGMQKSCSLVLLRRRGALAAAFSHDEAYMLHEADSANPVDRTLEYSRPIRSLKLWLAFRTYGADAFRAWIERTLTHAATLADAIEADPSLELLQRPTLSTVNFRHHGPGVDDVDAHNRRLARAIQEDGRVYLAAATVDGRVYLRVCFTNFRTTAADVAEILDVVRELGGELAAA
jgi:aromatic-L-amino-acid/L-tryptophan decarboxylase